MSNEDTDMRDNARELEKAVVGHSIRAVAVEQDRMVLTLDTGTSVTVRNTYDCCAFTDLDDVVLNLNKIGHVITSVKTEDGYTKWHIMAQMDAVLKMDVSWSEGSGYYMVGFVITVEENK